jgi:hypothetical protein
LTVAATDIFHELTEADPHSALGTTALAGVLAAKAAIERFSLPGTLLFFGEHGREGMRLKAGARR